MKHRFAAATSVAIAVAVLTTASALATPDEAGTTGRRSRHVAHFNLLTTPVKFSDLSRIQRWQLEDMLVRKERRGLRSGKVHVDGATITAIGNRHAICYAAWRPELGGGGSCSRFSDAVERGISTITICGGLEPGMVRISGIVRNGITSLGVDRQANGTIEETVPVISNAFSVELEPRGVILHGIGDAKAGKIELKYPLHRLTSASGDCSGPARR